MCPNDAGLQAGCGRGHNALMGTTWSRSPIFAATVPVCSRTPARSGPVDLVTQPRHRLELRCDGRAGRLDLHCYQCPVRSFENDIHLVAIVVPIVKLGHPQGGGGELALISFETNVSSSGPTIGEVGARSAEASTLSIPAASPVSVTYSLDRLDALEVWFRDHGWASRTKNTIRSHSRYELMVSLEMPRSLDVRLVLSSAPDVAATH